MKIKNFNVRVYAICIQNKKLLVIKEPFVGKMVTKLPGGGLELGEGPAECLVREFKEELNLTISNIEPFYIQQNFVPSLAQDKSQIVMLYFKVTINNYSELQVLEQKIEAIKWVEMTDQCPLDLPVDIEMYNYLKTKELR